MGLTGGWLCKAVRYQTSEPSPNVVRSCWCRLCQYIGAGSNVVNATFETSGVRVEGELREFRYVADSGNVVYWRFCPQCGTHVLGTSERRPHLTFVRVGTLDDPNAVRPGMTIWTASAPGWAPIDPALPRFERQPPMPGSPAP